MNKLILLAALCPVVAFASPICEAISEDAKVIMNIRQSNQYSEEMVLRACGNYHPAKADVCAAMTERAYDISLFTTDKYKKAIAREFAGMWYRMCLEAQGQSI